MPPVQISCPATGDLVPTGVTAMSVEELGDDALLLDPRMSLPEDGAGSHGTSELLPGLAGPAH